MEKNIIIHWDSLEYMKTLPDKCIDLVLTDIPYNECNRESNWIGKLYYWVADSSVFDMDILLNEIGRICRGSFYIFCWMWQFSNIYNKMKANFSMRCIVWEKTNPVPRNWKHIWLSWVEICVYWKLPWATYNWNCNNTVLRYPIESWQLHPTQKNYNLFYKLIETSSNPWDLILDCFAWSWTTAVACIETWRNYIVIEKEKDYIDIIHKRVKNTNTPLFTI